MPSFRTLMTAATAAFLLVCSAGAAAAAPAPPTPSVPWQTSPDPLAPYVGQVSCDPTAKPGASSLLDLLTRTYGTRGGSIGRSCSASGVSEHKEGRAVDWSVNVVDPVQKEKGDSFVAWLTGPDSAGVAAGNARRLGVMYVIWNRQTWQSWRANDVPGSGWKAYTGSSPHTDHVHISLSWDGAFQRTSWWTGRSISAHDYGPCQVYVGEPAPPYSAPNYTKCPPPTTRQSSWLLRTGPASAGAPTQSFTLGGVGSTVLACDVSGGGSDSAVVYQAGSWRVRGGATGSGSDLMISYGAAGMRPVCGDWDGNGSETIGVYDGSSWFLRNSNTPGNPDVVVQYGYPKAAPVTGDWDGDGRDTIGLYDNGFWMPRNSNTSGAPERIFEYGWSTVRPVVGDWDGDSRDGIGVFDGATWLLRQDATPGSPFAIFRYGWPGVAPVAGDWDPAASGGRHGVGVVDGGR